MSHMMHFCEGLDCDMENQGDRLIITIKGNKDKIAIVERKLKAIKELCCCCSKDEECCR